MLARLPRPPRWLVTLRTLAIMLVLGALLPAAQARAGKEGGSTMPPAVRMAVSLSGSGADGDFAAHAAGVVNATGDFEIVLITEEPELHTVTAEGIGDTVYVSEDGGPYSARSLSDVDAQSGMTDAAAACTVQLAALVGQSFAQSFYQEVGTPPGSEVIGEEPSGGRTLIHAQRTIPLSSLSPEYLDDLEELIGCGIPSQSFSLSLEQSELGGVAAASVVNDDYIDEATGRPYRSIFRVGIPSTGTVFTEETDTEPLPQAEPIVPPQPPPA
jgi:hypothetical protein